MLNAAARLIMCTCKYDRGLTQLRHSELHWLDVPERVQYKLTVTVHRCLQNRAPRYLVNCSFWSLMSLIGITYLLPFDIT